MQLVHASSAEADARITEDTRSVCRCLSDWLPNGCRDSRVALLSEKAAVYTKLRPLTWTNGRDNANVKLKPGPLVLMSRSGLVPSEVPKRPFPHCHATFQMAWPSPSLNVPAL